MAATPKERAELVQKRAEVHNAAILLAQMCTANPGYWHTVFGVYGRFDPLTGTLHMSFGNPVNVNCVSCFSNMTNAPVAA